MLNIVTKRGMPLYITTNVFTLINSTIFSLSVTQSTINLCFLWTKNCIYSYIKLQVTARNPSITRNETPEYPISPRTEANTTFGRSMQREWTGSNHTSSGGPGNDHNE